MATSLKVTQIKSVISEKQNQRDTLRSLGLKRIGDSWPYMILYFLLIIGFAYFYVYIAFNPDEVAENMRRQGGFVPGIRAGQPTADYLAHVLNRITFPGSIYLGIIALLPLIALATVNANQNFPLGGASILILVGVGLETVKQIDAQLQQRNYEGLLR